MFALTMQLKNHAFLPNILPGPILTRRKRFFACCVPSSPMDIRGLCTSFVHISLNPPQKSLKVLFSFGPEHSRPRPPPSTTSAPSACPLPPPPQQWDWAGPPGPPGRRPAPAAADPGRRAAPCGPCAPPGGDARGRAPGLRVCGRAHASGSLRLAQVAILGKWVIMGQTRLEKPSRPLTR